MKRTMVKILGTAVAVCMLLQTGAMAEGINTEGLTPVVSENFSDAIYEDVNVTNPAQASAAGTLGMGSGTTFITKGKYDNAVLEFDYKKNNTARAAFSKILWGIDSADTTKSFVQLFLYFNMDNGNQCVQKVIRNLAAGTNLEQAWMGGSNSSVPLYGNHDYTFRIEKSAATVNVFAKDRTNNETSFTMIGTATTNNFKVGAGYVQIGNGDSTTVDAIDNVLLYDLSLTAKLNNTQIKTKAGTKLGISFSNTVDSFSESDVSIVGSDNSEPQFTVSGSGKDYEIEFTSNLVNLQKYTVNISNTVTASGIPLEETALQFTAFDPVFSTDFSGDTSDVLTLDTNIVTSSGKAVMTGKSGAWENIRTINTYENPTFELDANMASGNTLQIWLSYNNANGNNGFNIFVSPDAAEASRSIHRRIAVNGTWSLQDGFVNNPGYIFESGVDYRIKLEMVGNSVNIYAKKLTEASYTLAGTVINDNISNLGKGIIWIYNITGGAAQSTVLDNFELYQYSSEISIEKEKIMPRAGGSINVNFSIAPNTAFTADDVVLKSADGQTVYSVNTEKISDASYKITFNEWLEYATEYKLCFAERTNILDGSVPQSFNFTTAVKPENDYAVENIFCKDANDTVYEKGSDIKNGLLSVSADYLANNNTSESLVAVCVLYDNIDGARLCKEVRLAPVTFTQTNACAHIEFDSINVTNVSNPSVTLLLWDGTQNMHPMTIATNY